MLLLLLQMPLLLLQVNTLITERDSMASHNLTLANTTSRLIAASAGGAAAQQGPNADTESDLVGQPLGDSLGAGGSDVDSIGAGLFGSGFIAAAGHQQRSVSAPGATEGGIGVTSQQTGRGNGITAQRAHSAAPAVGGNVMSPSQAREIGALLTRLTNENTQFLKARDAAVASRNEALNRAAALEAELELRQQEFR